MVRQAYLASRALFRLRGYEPQPVTPARLINWLFQFPSEDRLALLQLLNNVQVISKKEVIRSLVELNEEMLSRLHNDGIGIENVVYVSLDSAGSSSGVILNLLRDHANLERRGARFLHSKDVSGLQDVTKELGRGALVYVDDFAGTGKQFIRNRRHSAPYVIGSFAEFFLLACICEEALSKLDDLGVVPMSGVVHTKNQRPLHADATLLPLDAKQVLIQLCEKIHKQQGLGFEKLATSIVLYRNAPNTTPLILRGNLRQSPHCGILPRYDDLPFS